MSALSTQISMTDNISAVLNTISASLDTVNVAWESINGIEVFQNTGIERFQDEMQSLTSIAEDFLHEQAKISEQAANMEILPSNAINDINAANQRIQELGENLATMQDIDVSMLDDAAISRLNSEYEGMRGTLTNLINLQGNMNAAIEAGDFSALNSGFNQINNAAEAFEKRIRDNTHALQEMANIEWVSANNLEIFSGNDTARFTQEMEAANEMMRQMTFTQEQINANAANMDLLPPNAIQDISGMGDRITTLRSEIENMQNSRIEVVGIEQANAETEALRGQLQQALQAQEDMNRALQNMDASGANRAYQQLNSIVNTTERNIRDNIAEQQNFNNEIANGENAARGLKGIIAGIAGVLTVRAGINWIRESVNLTNENIRLEQQLANVMANRGATYEEFIRLQRISAQIQADTSDMISGTTMMGAANEFARHMGDLDAIEVMMNSLADFAAGAGNIFGATAEDMAAYAEYFTQAMAGNYRMLERRAGIYLTEIQKEVIKYGDDMERALMISDIVSASWEGLAEQMAATPEGMMVGMQNTFNDIRSSIGAQLLPVIMMLFQTIQAHMPQIEATIQGIVPIIQFIIGLISQVIEFSFMVGSVIADNWGMIAPIVWGIVAAFAAWKIITIIMSIKKAILTAVIWAKNIALLANPITWIILAIAALVAAVIAWVNHIGGLHIAWLVVMNAIMTAWDWVQIGFFRGINFVLDLWDRLMLGARIAGTAIANFMGDMRANVLSILQGMVNGAIDLINGMISTLNRIPGVNISTIERVTFGTQAQLENEAARQARNDALEAYRDQVQADIDARAAAHQQRMDDARAGTVERQAEIAYLRAAQNSDYESEYAVTHTDFVAMDFYGNEGFGSIGRDTSAIADNTGEMSGAMRDNLKYWRDIAERDTINRFTTARVTVRNNMGGITVTGEMDLDEVIAYIVEGVEEGIDTTAERTNDYYDG